MTYTPKKKYNLSSDKSRVVDKPDMENPIHGIRIGERDVFIQRLDGDGWFEVEQDDKGGWNTVDGLNRFNDGDTKAEAVESLSKKYKKTPESEITGENLEEESGEIVGSQSPTKQILIPEGKEKEALQNAFGGNLDLGYHGGTLGERTDYLTTGYRGEQPWTGYYFFSDADRAVSRGNRGKTGNKKNVFGVVDFSKYNLLKPTTTQYWDIKSQLKRYEDNLRNGRDISRITERILSDMPELGSKISNSRIEEIFNDWKSSEGEQLPDGRYRKEHFPTVILKDLGYEGIDVRGLKEDEWGSGSPDKSTEGSVIFDLKEGTVKRFKTKQQTDAQEIREVREEGEQEATQEESLGDMQEQPQAEEEATEGKKIRGAAKSASDLKNLAKEQREKILANPKNYYTPQVYEEIKDRMDTMDDSELVELMDDEALGGIREGDGNISVLAAVEAISRRLSDNKPIDDIVESMSKKGTSVAQALRQFAELKKSTPFGVLQYVNKKLSDFGVKMTEEQETELTQKVNDYLTAKAKFEQSKKKGADSLEETVSLEKEYQQAEREAMGMVARIVPKKFGDIVGATIQGNLLTPISQATNVVANVAQVPTRGGIEAVASIPDLVWSSLTGLPMTIKTTGLKAGAKGFVEGLSKAWEVILKGTNESDIAKGEVARSFAPMKAFAEAVSGTDIGKALTKLVPSLNLEKNRLPVSEKTGKPLTQERFKRLYESVFGFAPEVMFRLLSLGDKPFFYSEFNRALAEYAKEKGLTGKQKDFFMKYPDRLSQERAEQRAKEAVFMEESTLAKFSTKAVSELKNIVPSVVEKTPMPKWMADAISSAYRVLITTQIPFVRTPANVLSQTIDLAIPPLPLAKSAIYFRNARKIANGRSYEEMSQKEKADYNSSRRKGNINIGKAGVGAMMGVGASYLIANGLVSVLSGDDDEKTRNLQYQSFYPNTINLSGLERSLNGEDPSYRGGDRLIAFNKLGLFGMVLAIRAEQAKMDKRRGYKQTGKLEEQGQRMLSAIPAALRASFEQSFLAGTSSLLKALSGGERELDSWVRNSFKAFSSVALPNTLSAINRAERDYLPDMRVEGIDNQLMAIIKDRTFQTHDMPVRVDFWGEKIRQTPEGADPYVYQMIDVFKSRESSTDQKNTMIYDLYSKTLDREVIPSMPPRTIKVEGLDMRLNPEQYNRLATIVGKERARIVNKYIGNRSFQKKNPEQKVSTLSSIYKSALKTRDYIKERNKIKEELRATIPK
jgi:hypothetical protein